MVSPITAREGQRPHETAGVTSEMTTRPTERPIITSTLSRRTTRPMIRLPDGKWRHPNVNCVRPPDAPMWWAGRVHPGYVHAGELVGPWSMFPGWDGETTA